MMNKKIKILDKIISNQIAAGEVIDRPASIVKELIENSIDANATMIAIEIKSTNFPNYIKVTDDGDGISFADMEVMFLRHSTSKINTLEDLNMINSLGFRGEALSSIAAISKCTVNSATHLGDAYSIKCQGINQTTITPTTHTKGTSVIVEDLFFNLPARKKFLCSKRTELMYIENCVNKLGLSNFNVEFTLKINNRTVIHMPSANNFKAKKMRIAKTLNNNFINNSIYVKGENENVKFYGWISNKNFTRSQSDMQYLFVNNRSVRNKTLIQSIRKSYKKILNTNRYCAFVLFLEIDKNSIDINVHPQKLEVRFHKTGLVYDFIITNLMNNLENKDYNNKTEEKDSKVIEEKDSKVRDFLFTNDQFNIINDEEFSKQITFINPNQKLYKKSLNISVDDNINFYIEKTELTKFGNALAPLDDNYILSQNYQGLTIINVEKAYRYICYNMLQQQYIKQHGVMAQRIEESVVKDIPTEIRKNLNKHGNILTSLALGASWLSEKSMIFRTIPKLLDANKATDIINDILKHLQNINPQNNDQELLNKILYSIAIYYPQHTDSILKNSEMHELLYRLEQVGTKNMSKNHLDGIYKEISYKELNEYFKDKR